MKVTHVRRKVMLSALAGAIMIPGSAIRVKAAESKNEGSSLLPIAGIESVLTECLETNVKDNIDLYLIPTNEGEYLNRAFSNVKKFSYIRNAPNEESEWTGKLYEDSTVTVLRYEGDWTKIRSGNVEGYVPADALYTGDEAKKHAKEYETDVVTVLADVLNVRSGQGTENDILTQVMFRQQYEVTGEPENGWYPVKVGGFEGWVCGEYVEAESTFSYAESREEEEQRLARGEEVRQSRAGRGRNVESNGNQSNGTAKTQVGSTDGIQSNKTTRSRTGNTFGVQSNGISDGRTGSSTGSQISETAAFRTDNSVGSQVSETAASRTGSSTGSQINETAASRTDNSVGIQISETAASRTDNSTGSQVSETAVSRTDSSTGSQVSETAVSQADIPVGNQVSETAVSQADIPVGNQVNGIAGVQTGNTTGIQADSSMAADIQSGMGMVGGTQSGISETAETQSSDNMASGMQSRTGEAAGMRSSENMTADIQSGISEATGTRSSVNTTADIQPGTNEVAGTQPVDNTTSAIQTQFQNGDAAQQADSTAEVQEAAAVQTPEYAGQAVIDFACQFIGNPYVWGGTSLTNGADCSGFVQSVYANFGIALPRTTWDMVNVGYEVSYDQALPGDLVLYDGHVGLYMGDGTIVNAMNEAQGIGICTANYAPIITIRRVL